jgi:hypothetical protein
LPQFAERFATEDRGEKGPIGFQRLPDLSQDSRHVVGAFKTEDVDKRFQALR